MKIWNAKLANGNLVNIEISNGLITKVDKATAGNVTDGIDAKSKLLIPGLVDLHTHLREPGREDAETVLTGSRSAVLVVTQRYLPWRTQIQLQITQELLNKFIV